MVRPADRRRAVARMVGAARRPAGLPALRHARRSQGGQTYSHALLREPRRARAAGAADRARRQGRRPDRHRPGAVHDPRRHRERAGRRRRRLQPRPARAHRLRRPAVDRPARASAAAPDASLLVRVPDERSRAAGARRCARDFEDEFVNARSYRSTEDRDRPRLRSRRELPEPGRAGHRHPRRHRRVERHARVRPAEDPQHRGAEVRRRAQRADHRGLHAAGDGARPGRQPARRRARARWRSPRFRWRSAVVDVAPGRGALRRHLERRRCRGSAIGLLVSLLFSVVPLLEVRFVKPSLLLRDETHARRRATGLGIGALVARVGWRWSALTAWQAASLQVGLVVCAGFCRAGRRAAAGRAGCSSRRSRRSRTRRRFRCGTRCCTCRGPATRRASSCSPSASARSSSSASARCRRACSRSSRSRSSDDCARHVPARHPARAGGRRARVSRATRRTAPGAFQLIPVLRARVVGVAGRETNLDERRGGARQRGVARPRVHDHLSRSPRAERAGDRGRVLERAVDRARSVDRAADSPSARGSTSATRCGSTSSAGSSARASPASATSTGATRATAASCSCSGPARSTRRRRPSSSPLKGPDDAGGARRGSSTTSSSSSRTCR